MKQREDDSLMSPPLEELVSQIPQKYELVLAATKRAKQIIREQRLNPGLVSDDLKARKPLTMALHDIAEGRVDKQVLDTPDVEFDDLGDTDDLQTEIERMGVLPFTTRPAPEFAEPITVSEDFTIDDDEEDDEDLDAEADFDDETADPPA